MRKLWWTLATLVVGAVLAVGPARAQNVSCTGTLPAGSYTNVTVPAGQFCTVNNAVTVAGNVTVGTGATLYVPAANFVVNGTILGTKAANVDFLLPVTIGANISLTGTTNYIQIETSFIGGALSVINSTASAINVLKNNVAASVLFRDNTTSGAGSDVISGNTIGGSLLCTGNAPAPTDSGIPNVVGGNKVGQCTGL
jgi:hypothetical protein